MSDENGHLGGQLTFDVGEAGDEQPVGATIKISGGLLLTRELKLDERCMVRLIGPDGEQIAAADGEVTFVGFKTKSSKDLGKYKVREHTVKLDSDD